MCNSPNLSLGTLSQPFISRSLSLKSYRRTSRIQKRGGGHLKPSPNRLDHLYDRGPRIAACKCAVFCIAYYIVPRYNTMNSRLSAIHPGLLLTSLAEFRFELRRFLQFSEQAALAAGLQPQQHQLLLQVAAAPEGTAVTIAYAAERLGLRHNTAVELVDRAVREGLLLRTMDAEDQRRVLLRATRKGERLLGRLAADHARELQMAPSLAGALERIRTYALGDADGSTR